MINPPVLVNWLWNEPIHIGADQKPLPIFVLQVRVAGVPERKAYQIVMSPAQVDHLCAYGSEGVLRQLAAFGDARPREFDAGNIKAAV